MLPAHCEQPGQFGAQLAVADPEHCEQPVQSGPHEGEYEHDTGAQLLVGVYCTCCTKVVTGRMVVTRPPHELHPLGRNVVTGTDTIEGRKQVEHAEGAHEVQGEQLEQELHGEQLEQAAAQVEQPGENAEVTTGE
mgnify:CR=1 FL=1